MVVKLQSGGYKAALRSGCVCDIRTVDIGYDSVPSICSLGLYQCQRYMYVVRNSTREFVVNKDNRLVQFWQQWVGFDSRQSCCPTLPLTYNTARLISCWHDALYRRRGNGGGGRNHVRAPEPRVLESPEDGDEYRWMQDINSDEVVQHLEVCSPT